MQSDWNNIEISNSRGGWLITFAEDYEVILKAGTWTRCTTCPPLIEEWESEGELPPQGGIQLINEDVETEDGVASDGTLIYEIQPGIILGYAHNKTERENMLRDILDIIKASGDNAIPMGYLPTTFMDKKGFELRYKRIVNVGDD